MSASNSNAAMRNHNAILSTSEMAVENSGKPAIEDVSPNRLDMDVRKMCVPAEKCITGTTFSMPRVLAGHIAEEERHWLRTNMSNVRLTGASGRGLVAHAISMWKEAQNITKITYVRSADALAPVCAPPGRVVQLSCVLCRQT
jgi:hypothetical protein